MTIKPAMPDGSTPPDLTLPVTITGVKNSPTITLERKAKAAIVFVHESNQELGKIIVCWQWCLWVMFIADSYDSTMYMCQAFYHKGGINHWKATLAFFPKEKQLVK